MLIIFVKLEINNKLLIWPDLDLEHLLQYKYVPQIRKTKYEPSKINGYLCISNPSSRLIYRVVST